MIYNYRKWEVASQATLSVSVSRTSEIHEGGGSSGVGTESIIE